jgi:hypothetical protein
METIIEKQADGYSVTAEGEMITVHAAKRDVSAHVSNFIPFAQLSLYSRERLAPRVPDTKGLWFLGLKDVVRVRDIGTACVRVLEIAAKSKADYEAREIAAAKERTAADAPFIQAMLEKEAALVAQIPAGCVRLEAHIHEDSENGSYADFTAPNGVTMPSGSYTQLGWACAIRTGAQNGFQERCVAYATQAQIDAVTAARDAAISKRNAEQDAEKLRVAEIFKQARETGKQVALESWCETRRAQECGEWGDYTFKCTKVANPDGSTSVNAVNTF